MADEGPTNRLADCTSPYLLQHASNPVAWQPWDDDAIELARTLDRPLLVSIGYAACHWCHVMEHESFADEATAAMMNERLVCIKVDREERPDVDALYMAACQALTGAGGWPLNAFVDPNTLKPFFAGTYYPPDQRYGRPSWTQIVTALSDTWRDERDGLLANAEQITDHIGRMAAGGEAGDVAGEQDLTEMVEAVAEASVQHSLKLFDAQNGGFGGAPKFPHPMELEGLLRNGSEEAQNAVEVSLRHMAERGLFDHLGGGWHRYCVDAQWAVPHFEKMLYDNALLLPIHARALREGIGDSALHERVILLTLEWLEREMFHPGGGVWSTLDADSDDGTGHKEEGAFYVWNPTEVEAALGEEDGALACARWTVTKSGNFEESGSSVLALAPAEGLTGEAEEELRLALLDARAERARPGTDDKVLSAWNGMLLVALSDLAGERAENVGEHVAKGLLARSTKPDGSVVRTWRGETDGGAGFLDDHAWAALGLLRWGLLTDDETCIERASAITNRLLESFSDPDGGFWLASADHEELPVRQRCENDSAVPGSTAVVVRLLATHLGAWPAHPDADSWRASAEGAIQRLGDSLMHRGPAYWALLNAAADLLQPWSVWHIHHDGTEPEAVENLRQSEGERQLVISTERVQEERDRGDAPWMAWLCEGMTCKAPITAEPDLVW